MKTFFRICFAALVVFNGLNATAADSINEKVVTYLKSKHFLPSAMSTPTTRH